VRSAGPTEHTRRKLLLETGSEEVTEGEWSASFAVFTDDRDRALVYWMPSLFMAFPTAHQAEQAARSAGLWKLEQLEQEQPTGVGKHDQS
jgi:hypothetical protein